jgi:hypothetical protein
MSKKSTLADVLGAVGIKTVLWIDDRFDVSGRVSDPTLDADMAGALGALYAAKQAPKHPRLSSLRVDADFDEWQSVVEELVEKSPADVVEIVSSLQAQVAALELAERDAQAEGQAAAEYNDKELEAILASFGGAVEKFGLEQWKAQRQEILSKRISRETLFIVDREFRVDGATVLAGDEILRDLVDAREGDANVVMLTHSRPAAGLEALRTELAATLKLPVQRFSVMAKGGDGQAEARLSKSVRVLMTHQTCFNMLERIANAMVAGIEAARNELAGQSVYDLDQVIFERSLEEGASEADVLARLVMLRQRMAVDDMLAKDRDCFVQIHALRELRAIAEWSPDGDESRGPLTLLPNWRRHEVFDDGELVNLRHSPISCGDVFRAKDAQCVWVLLAQPCDIAVRSDGNRKFEEAVLVKARPIPPRTTKAEAGAPRGAGGHAEGPSQRYFKLPGLLGESEWQLDFIDWGSVSLRCLDLAAFNADGALALMKDHAAPPALLPGWRIRLAGVLEDFKRAQGGVPKIFELLSLSENLSNRTPKADQDGLRFAYFRVGRIRPPRAVAAYSAFSAFQSRAAYDHDFADKLSQSG